MKTPWKKSADKSEPSNEPLPDWKQELETLKEAMLIRYEDEFRNLMGEASREFRERMIKELLTESRAYDIHQMQQQLDGITIQIQRLAQLVTELIHGEPQPNETLLDLVERVESLEQAVGSLRQNAPRR